MEAIVFDWDGTLVDTLPAILRVNVEVMHEYGVPFDEDRYRAAYVPDWRLMYQRLGVHEADLERAGARWLSLYRALAAPVAFPGVGDALRRLQAEGHAMGLVTAGHRDVVDAQLDSLGLAELLPIRVCGDDALASKPYPEPLLRALADLGAAATVDRAIYVGDAPDDMRMAKAVGARAIGIVSILGSERDLRAAGADEVVPSVTDWVSRFLPGARSPESVAGAG